MDRKRNSILLISKYLPTYLKLCLPVFSEGIISSVSEFDYLTEGNVSIFDLLFAALVFRCKRVICY